MAERRMFAKTIIDSDAFLDMPISARLLYYDLGMRADDDGFVNSPKKIMKMIGATNDDMNILILRKFVIAFESGVIVIKHWRINNYLRSDRYHKTLYVKEKEQLEVDDKGNYHFKDDVGIPKLESGIPSTVDLGKDSIGKDRLGKDSIESSCAKRFTPPTVEEVRAYCNEKGYAVDPERFVDFYESKGWMVGKSKMKDWKACVRNWERQDKKVPKRNSYVDYEQRKDVDYDEIERLLQGG